MEQTFYTTEIYKADHAQFGGIIYPSDYITDYRRKDNTNGSPIARRITSDQQFDKQCRNNKINQQNYGGNKNA